MEIASAMPCDGGATGAASTSVGAAPSGAFRICLGSAVDREQERATAASARTGAAAGSQPPQRTQEGAAEAASAEAQATNQPAEERPEREEEDALVAVAPSPGDAVPPVVVTPLALTGTVAVGATEPPAGPSSQPPPQQIQPPPQQIQPPTAPPPPQGQAAAQAAQEGSVATTVLSSDAGPAPAAASAAPQAPSADTGSQQHSFPPEAPHSAAAPSRPVQPTAARNNGHTGVAGASLSATEAPEDTTLSATRSAEPAEAPAPALGNQGPETLRNRLGAARLWGYWLRNGNVAPGGGMPSQPTAEGEPGQLPVGATSAPWAPRLGVTAEATTAGAIPAEAGGGRPANARFEPPALASVAGLGSGSAQGPERTDGVIAPPNRAPAPPPEPPQQIANAVRLAVLRGGDRVTVQMEPASLGKVHVELLHGSDGVRASFRVENPLTHQALQADAPLLKQALEARGVNVAFVSVELDQGDQRGRDPLNRHAPGRRRRLGGEDDGEIRLEDLPLRASTWRPWGFDARA